MAKPAQIRDLLYGFFLTAVAETRWHLVLRAAHLPAALAILRARGLDGVADELEGVAAAGGVSHARDWWLAYAPSRSALERKPHVGPTVRAAGTALFAQGPMQPVETGLDLAVRSRDARLAHAMVAAAEAALAESWPALAFAERLALLYPSDLGAERERVLRALRYVAESLGGREPGAGGAYDPRVRDVARALARALARSDRPAADAAWEEARRLGEGPLLMNATAEQPFAVAFAACMATGRCNARAADRVAEPLLESTQREIVALTLAEPPRLSAWSTDRVHWWGPPEALL